MRKQHVLIWGNGNTWRQNCCWIRQIYDVVGITAADVREEDAGQKLYPPAKAVELEYEFVMVVSIFFDEIRNQLVSKYGIRMEKIKNFEDEFNEERHVQFGDKNEDVTFYILRAHWQERMNGFFNFYDRAVMVYYHTHRLGYELLIDMKNYYTEYAGNERYGKENIWEDYFSQPSRYTLEEAYESSNVILSKFGDEYYNTIEYSAESYLSGKWYVETYSMLAKACKGWTCPSPGMELHIRDEKRKFMDKGKVLGVLARGTDMIYLRPQNHFVPYKTECFIESVEAYMKQKEYQYLYLATEDSDILRMFLEHFKERLIVTEQWRTSQTTDKMLMAIKSGRENDGYLRGMEYCLVVSMLAECDALVANCLCGGVLGAMILNEGAYMDIDVADAGLYS